VGNSDFGRSLVQGASVHSFILFYLSTGSHIVTHIGDVYFATNVVTGEGIAVKMEPLDADYPKLAHEWEVYKSMGNGPGIPHILWCGAERGYRAMSMSLLGPSLEDLFNRCDRKFTLKTVLMLADQLVSLE
jgi:casein kinase I family protein HRR25